MQEILNVSFFDEGAVLRGGRPVRFPYMKARLLFLMLLEAEKPLARKKLCATIWQDEPEKAKQNLRNALSALRRVLPEDCVLADRETAWIGGAARIESDLTDLCVEKIDENNVERLARPFLGKLYASGEAVLWMMERERHYKKKLRAALEEKIAAAGAEQKEFWQLWLQTLDGAPDKKEKSAPAKNEIPFVRTEERDAILTFLRDASEADARGARRCAVIYGEEGSGKSVLAKEIFEHMEGSGLPCYHGHPLEGGRDYREALGAILEKLLGERPLSELKLSHLYESYLKTSFPDAIFFRQPVEQQGKKNGFYLPKMDFNPHLLGRIFAHLFNQCGATSARPVFLLLEDVHWAAQWIPDFLRGLFESIRVPFTTLLTSYPDLKPSLDLAFVPLQDTVRRSETLLSRLTIRQTEQLCRQVLPPQLLTPEKLADIYDHTGGSPFLLGEFLRFYDADDWSDKLSRSLDEIVHSRLLSLTEEEMELLQCVAAFPGEAHFEPLRALAELQDAELLKRYEGLRRKGLLYDRASGDSYVIFFRYSLTKKQIKASMPQIKWWNLHKRLLEICTGSAQTFIEDKYLAEIACDAGDYMAELRARVSELKKHFEFNHELFPKLSDAELFETPRMVNDTQLTASYLEEAQKRLDRLIREQGKAKELIRHERTLLTIQGGYLRWNGDYAGAANCLREALKIALQQTGEAEAVVDVLEQLCYLGIQQDDAKMLEGCVYHFYRAAQKAQMAPQAGMALRFIAVLNIIKGSYDLAEKQLKMSLRLFEKLEANGQEYTLSVIAATHYHGDIALYKGEYEAALRHYLQCARLCEDKGFYRGLGVHLAKAAWCELRLGRLADMKERLAFARPLFEGYRSRRGAGLCGGEIVFGLSALLSVWDGRPEKAREQLRSAEELGSIIQKPLWEGLLFCVKALLRERATTAPALHALLKEEADDYAAKSAQILGAIGLSREALAYTQYRGFTRDATS